VPGHLRPAAKTYRNPHDAADAAADQAYLPRGVTGGWYQPPGEGQDAGIKARMAEREGRRDRPPRRNG